MKREGPKAYQNRVSKLRGLCPECGKSVMLRINDGKIRSHYRRKGLVRCVGSSKTPSKSATSEKKKHWEAPRRTS